MCKKERAGEDEKGRRQVLRRRQEEKPETQTQGKQMTDKVYEAPQISLMADRKVRAPGM